MAKLFSQTLAKINKNRQRKIDGKLNCLPFGLPRFERVMAGVEQGRYYLVTANQKAGKSTLTDHMFVYNPVEFVLDNPQFGLDVEVFYFLLEESRDVRMSKCMSRRLKLKHKKRFNDKMLYSIYQDFTLDESIIKLIEEDKQYYDDFLSKVNYIDHVRTSNGILGYMKKVLNSPEYGSFKDNQYVPVNPDKYIIIIIDHAGNLTDGKDGSEIGKISQGLVMLRNIYNVSPVLVQQQNMQQEGFEAQKLGQLEPTISGLGLYKNTGQDINYAFALFCPAKLEIYRKEGKKHRRYEVCKYGETLKFLKVLPSRNGGNGAVIPLYMDGACVDVEELPSHETVMNDNRLLKKIAEANKHLKF